MEVRFQNSPKETASMHTEELRKNCVCESLMQDDQLNLVYSHYDRMIIGGAKPVNSIIVLENEEELKSLRVRRK
jgi:4-deoxy-L-threo-5-hexosulose-uronate ketol-isomerase